MLSTLLAAALCALAAPSVAPQSEDLDLGREIRSSVRWLRGTQDLETGAYPGGLDATALAVIAFASCPDRYRAVDGPFVRKALEHLAANQAESGAVGPDRSAEEVLRSTHLAAIAFRLGDGGHAEPRARARGWIERTFHAGVVEDLPAVLGFDDAPTEPERALALAAELIAAREDDGSWVGPAGSASETARRIVLLSHLNEVAGAEEAQAREPARVEDLPAFSPEGRASALAAIRRGGDFLAALADEEGRFGAPGRPDAGLSAMALGALQALPEPRPERVQRVIDGGLAWLVSLQHEDGSIHDGKLANYITSASILALAKAGRPEHREVLARAGAFLQRLQLDEEDGYSEGDLHYGGIGYGSTERPDLSNLQMALEALSRSGVEDDSQTYAKALRFLQRVQNRSESNDLRIEADGAVLRSGDDGGAGYAPGQSKAGFVELSDGTRVPRSYGSMTYALLKCYVFAGLERDDPRLAAAFAWCQENYTLDINPGFQHSLDPSAAYQGLFYYFLTMARALEAFGAERIVTPDGTAHAWREELCGRLVAMQSKLDGSWLNRNSPRWYEGNPLLATSYALLALEAALPPASAAGGR